VSSSTLTGTRARMATVACCIHSPASGPSPLAPRRRRRCRSCREGLDWFVIGEWVGATRSVTPARPWRERRWPPLKQSPGRRAAKRDRDGQGEDGRRDGVRRRSAEVLPGQTTGWL
jgi:hypothetical protein